ncbi:MAG: DUF1573 domain-containing protein [Acidobacteriales bacterium]|nr:DUF1573 domain-containing protein [Terriglobales bacterium]
MSNPRFPQGSWYGLGVLIATGIAMATGFAWLVSGPEDLGKQEKSQRSSRLRAVFGETTSLSTGVVVLDRIREGMSIALTNPTDRQLVIDRVDSGCGCLGAEVVPKAVEPGGQAELLIKPVLHGSRGQRAVRLRLHSSTHGPWELVLSGLFIRDFHWEPGELLFPDLDPGQRRTAQVLLNLLREGTRPLELDMEVIPNGTAEVSSFRFVASEQCRECVVDQYEINVAVTAVENSHETTANLVVRNGQSSTAPELRVRWSVRPPLAVFPATCGFVGRDAQQRIVFLESNDGTPFRVLQAACDQEWVKVVAGDQEPARQHRLRLALRGDAPQSEGPLQATVRIHLDHPKRSQAEVSISWLP